MSEPLTADEEGRIKERHRPVELTASTLRPKPVWCATCGSMDRPWPCDAARLLLSFAAVEERVRSAHSLPVGDDSPSPQDDWTRLAEAWANVMDGRRIGTGLNAARVGRDTTTPTDWHDIAAEYARLSKEDTDDRP